MQSFLQYRRFGQHLQYQIDTHNNERRTSPNLDRNSSDLSQQKEKDDDADLPEADALQVQPSEDNSTIERRITQSQLHQILTGIRSNDAANPKDEQEAEAAQGIHVVDFHGPDDPLNPHNWSHGRKWLYTAIVGSTGFLVSGASAFDSEIVPQAMKEYGISEEVELLSTSLYMISLGLGGLVSAPFSETVGRNPVYIISLTLFALFTVGSALAPNIQTQLVCRFFMGLFGSPPLVTFGGSMSDMWAPLQRTYIFPILACLTFLGPFLAPMVADFIATSPYVSWHWTEWITLIVAGVIIALIFFVVPETYAPVLLGWKAEHLRRITSDPGYRSPSDINHVSLGRRLLLSISRPVEFLLTEPIVDLFALYLVIVYIILFGFLPGFDFIFGPTGIYGLDQKHTGLCFLPMNVGFLLALVPITPIFRRYKRKTAEAEQSGKGRVPPEERLIFSMIGAPFLPISVFWMGWTSWSSVSIWSPLVASALFGFATMCIFISCYQYIIDAYETFSASALVGMTVTRYLASAPMVIVSVPMYSNLGVHWALTLLGCLAALMTPVPYIFYRFGPAIRKKSRSATNFE